MHSTRQLNSINNMLLIFLLELHWTTQTGFFRKLLLSKGNFGEKKFSITEECEVHNYCGPILHGYYLFPSLTDTIKINEPD